jgi:hypothetical protein
VPLDFSQSLISVHLDEKFGKFVVPLGEVFGPAKDVICEIYE